MLTLSYGIDNIYFISSVVLGVVIFAQHLKIKRDKAMVMSYRAMNRELLASESQFRQQLLDIHYAVENQGGGVENRMLENLHIANTVQRQAPDLLANRPTLASALESNQRFFEAIYDATKLDRPVWTTDQVVHLRNSAARGIFATLRTQPGNRNSTAESASL
ncbi:hypothetical protein [Comamonas thiooxydans]|uniref:hypothetical protein n=1 Tax=Comamonas thiooxydans TaxID=363952 RepID=UPI00050DCB16|nr:hypothetical protein [Comamonas thiooxydans]KGH23570.1 hypothetical protein P606_11675 [Comamonas thiooxydans]